MHRNIKKIIGITLVISAFGASLPTVDFNLMTTKAYAENDDGVQSIRIKSSGGGGLTVYSDNDYKSAHEVQSTEIEPNGIYYAKTSSKEIKVSVDGPDSDCVRVFGDTSSSTRGVRGGNGVNISDSGTVIVRIYSTDPGVVKYSDSGYISQYKFKIKYNSSDDNNDDEKDHVFLKNITLSSGDINFAKYTYTYDVNVDEDINKLTIGASPDCDSDEYDYYKVKIDGGAVDKDDKFKDTVNLNNGKNVIEVTVKDDEDNERTYTLNVTRGGSSTANTSNTDDNSKNNTATNNSNKINGWIEEANGKWQYKDAAGSIAKNTWVQNYYVQADGNMATDWLKIDDSWYYFGTDGAKKIGWQYINGNWYYLDSQGKMQIGWMKDLSGKYYYLNSDGSMAYSTTINGYKLGTDGAWIGK